MHPVCKARSVGVSQEGAAGDFTAQAGIAEALGSHWVGPGLAVTTAARAKMTAGLRSIIVASISTLKQRVRALKVGELGVR